MTVRIAIIGGGISGLATAFELLERDPEVALTVYEETTHVGGNIATAHEDGFTIEGGPNGFLDAAPDTLSLVERLALGGEVQRADPAAAKRFLLRGGRLHALPHTPGAFFRSSLLSPRGRLRVGLEPLIPRRRSTDDESVLAFASRRIGHEAASVLVDAMVSGIFAGDVATLSVQSAFPKLQSLEARHGGLVRGMIATRRDRSKTGNGGPAGPAGTLTSFRNGLQVLPNRLAERLGARLQLGWSVCALERAGDEWILRAADGREARADHVLLAVPAPQVAQLLAPLDARLGAIVREIPAAPIAVVALGYTERAAGGPLPGFGYLVPRGEGMRTLGCLWDSSVFPGRAPVDHVLMRVMIGGAHDPLVLDESDDALVAIARRELRGPMNLVAEPRIVRVVRYPVGIAQYVVGHGARLAQIRARLAALPSVHVSGSSFFGVALNACIARAPRDADALLVGAPLSISV